MFPKSRNELPRMSVTTATEYVRRMVQRETRGWGDLDNAMQRLETRYGLPFWPLWHLRKGKAKSVETSMFARIEAAYLDMCGKQAANLLMEVERDNKAAGHDLDADIAEELAALLAKIEARKARAK